MTYGAALRERLHNVKREELSTENDFYQSYYATFYAQHRDDLRHALEQMVSEGSATAEYTARVVNSDLDNRANYNDPRWCAEFRARNRAYWDSLRDTLVALEQQEIYWYEDRECNVFRGCQYVVTLDRELAALKKPDRRRMVLL